MNFISSVRRITSLVGVTCLACNCALATDIEPPKVEVVDKFGVNVATGQVTQGLTTVSIGGAMGLSHRISIYANEFYYKNMRGFSDNMRSVTTYVQLSNDFDDSPMTVLRVNDGSDSASFRVEKNGVRVEQFAGTQQPYTYIPVGDQRHSLAVNGILLEWTKPDGTVVKFTRHANATAAAEGLLSEIVYPNGFTITYPGGGTAMRSNTGYMLKSIYGSDTRLMDKPDNPNLYNVMNALTSQASGWSGANPIEIKAINAAICAPTASTCETDHEWPTAKFDWPPGMPRTMYIGESIVKITDARGGVTKYRYLAHDLAYNELGYIEPGRTPNREFSPRLVGVTPAGSTAEHFTYEYKNTFVYDDNYGDFALRANSSGVVTSATHISKATGYNMRVPFMDTTSYTNSTGGGAGVVNVLMRGPYIPGNPDAISYATLDDGQVTFESSARNFPENFFKNAGVGVPEKYEYDARGNLVKVSRRINGVYMPHREAKYADSCTSANRKYCNQAEWIKDAKGNRTDYTYHAPSGQVASITYPPNKHDVRAQTRYEYSKYQAHYFDDGPSKIYGGEIWLKRAEKYCINSASTGSGCNASDDEVVTTYEYDHDNLLMTGMTMTDSTTGTTLRTCFQYDKYGNQIGKTAPKAGLTECPRPESQP